MPRFCLHILGTSISPVLPGDLVADPSFVHPAFTREGFPIWVMEDGAQQNGRKSLHSWPIMSELRCFQKSLLSFFWDWNSREGKEEFKRFSLSILFFVGYFIKLYFRKVTQCHADKQCWDLWKKNYNFFHSYLKKCNVRVQALPFYG